MRPEYCDKHQYDAWTTSDPRCPTYLGNHTFEGDIAYFLANQRHNAQAVAVWIVTGSDLGDRSDGLIAGGGQRAWLTNYQLSSP
jgi:hypothetical protein